jgi:kynureninase
VGAGPGEVVLADATTVCLYKAAVAALRARPGRTVVLTDDANFPSDIQALRAAVTTVGGDCQVVILPSDGVHGPIDAVAEALDGTVALLSLSHVAYRSGWCWDLPATTAMAHAAGALVLWDLSHSVGVVPIDLHEAGVDLAVGCTYKYLNGGPGAPAFIYVSAGRADLVNPVAGWQGSDDPFSFNSDAGPAPGATGFLTGTPPIVSAALVEPGVDLVLEAGVTAIRAKSVALTERFVTLVDHHLDGHGFVLDTPRAPECRGSHVSLTHPDARAIGQALIHEQGVVGDFRPPDILRYGFVPLYTTFADVDAASERTVAVVTGGGVKRWRDVTSIVP